jgi:predicted  nucleic acid-binding Zn-ribbon protein
MLLAPNALAQDEEEGYPIGEHGGQVIPVDDLGSGQVDVGGGRVGVNLGERQGSVTGQGTGVRARTGQLTGTGASIPLNLPNQPKLPKLPTAFDALRLPEGQSAVPAQPAAPTPGQPPAKLSVEEIDRMMQRLAEGDYTLKGKQKMVAEIFYHSPEYRRAVMRREFPAKSAGVDAFLEGKRELQRDVIRHMGELHKQRYGVPPSGPVIPFDYNNIHSDDDIITGSGQLAAKLEPLYNEALNDVIQKRTGRSVTAADRAKIDVNGLSWNMTAEGGVANFDHPEKYINPQTGFDNQQKLAGGNLEVHTWDVDGNPVVLTGEDARQALRELDVDRPLNIPGIDPKAGSGVIADNLRMADLHKVEFEPGRIADEDEISHFIRNQKYTPRVSDPFMKVAADTHPDLISRYGDFLDLSKEIRKRTDIRGVAEVLDGRYGERIIVDGVVDRAALTRAMQKHQALQLQNVMPEMLRAVTENEAVKMAEWIRNASGPDRHMLRKQLALTYAPVDPAQRQKVLDDLDQLEIDPGDKAFLRNAIDKDARRLVRYAELADMDIRKLVNGLELRGDSFLAVDLEIMNYRPVKHMGDALWGRPGGTKFKEFLRSKTARALNLDVMLDVDIGSRGEKLMQWSMVMLAAGRAYSAASDETEAYKAMAMGLFEMIPGVSATLRFSEGEFRQAFKDLTMDVLPPLALAELAVQALNFTGQFAINSMLEDQLDQVARTELNRLSDADFVESEYLPGHFVLRNREAFFEFMQEISPGLGSKLGKFDAIVTQQVDAIQQSSDTYQTNIKALHTLNYFEEVPKKEIEGGIERRFTPLELKQRVWEAGIPGIGEASPVERVAAKLIAENLGIRAAAYDIVLNQLVDRIEDLYNEQRGDPQVVNESRLMDIRLKLRELYENAPELIKINAFTGPRLDEEYSVRDEKLRDYPLDGFVVNKLREATGYVDDADFEREMQALLEEFEAVIAQLLIAARYFDEARDLELVADYYGGDTSMQPLHGFGGDEIGDSALVMGDEFRVGISARVARHRRNQDWTVFYYSFDRQGPALLGSARLTPGKYGEGDGLMVIEAPEPETFVHVKGEPRDRYFAKLPAQRIYPVLAFGEWPSDPVATVGIRALNYPAEHWDMFDGDRMAFLGEPLTVRQVEPVISLEVPHYVVEPERQASARLHVAVPEYARQDVMEAKLEVVPGDSAAVPPDLGRGAYGRVSTDGNRPDTIDLRFSDATTHGYYTLAARVRMKRVGMDSQPAPQQAYFQYLPAEEEEPGATAEGIAGSLDQLRALEAEATAIAGQVGSEAEAIAAENVRLVGELFTLAQAVLALDERLAALRDRPPGGGDPNRIALLEKDVYSAGLRLGEIRSRIEQLALYVCQDYEAMRAERRVTELDAIFSGMHASQRDVQTLEQRFGREVSAMQSMKAQADAEFAKGASGNPELEALRAELPFLRNQQQTLEQALAAVQGRAQQQRERQLRAAMLEDQAGGIAAELREQLADGDQRRGELESLLASIQASRGQTDAAVAGSLEAGGDTATLAAETAGTLDSVEQKLAARDRAMTGTDRSQALQQAMAQFNASYEAGMLFADPIRFAASSTATCMQAAGPLYRDKTRPEIRVAQTDCSMFGAAEAVWDAGTAQPRCQCRAGYVPTSGGNYCERDRYAGGGGYSSDSSGGSSNDSYGGYSTDSYGGGGRDGYGQDGYGGGSGSGGGGDPWAELLDQAQNSQNSGNRGSSSRRPKCTGNAQYDRVISGAIAGGCDDGSGGAGGSGAAGGGPQGQGGYYPGGQGGGCFWEPPHEVDIYGLGQGVQVGWSCSCLDGRSYGPEAESRCGPRPQ